MQYILSDVDVISIIDKNTELFSQNSMLKDAIRMLGWGIIKILKKVASSAEFVFDKAFSLIDITTWLPVTEFGKSFSPVFKVVLCLSIFAIALMLLFKNEKLNINPIVSIILFFFVTMSGVTVIGELNEVVKLGKEEIKGNQINSVNSIIRNDFYDLLYIDKKQGLAKLESEEPVRYDSLSDKDIEYINITEVINPNSEHLTTKEATNILGKYVFLLNGEKTEVEVYNGFGWNSKDDADFGNQFYYRYSYNFWTIALGLLVIILIYLLSGYKEVQLIYDILVSSILAPIFSSDMSSSAKIKKILIGIRDGYISMLFIVLNIRMFFFFKEFLATAVPSNPLVRIILEFFVALVVIDGPNVMEKLTGRDVGMKAGLGGVIASVYAAKMAKDGAINTMRTVKNTGQAAGRMINNMKDKYGSSERKDMPGTIGGNADKDKTISMPGAANGQENRMNENGVTNEKGTDEKGTNDISNKVPEGESKQKENDMKKQKKPDDSPQKKNMDAMKGHIDSMKKNGISGEEKNNQMNNPNRNPSIAKDMKKDEIPEDNKNRQIVNAANKPSETNGINKKDEIPEGNKNRQIVSAANNPSENNGINKKESSELKGKTSKFETSSSKEPKGKKKEDKSK